MYPSLIPNGSSSRWHSKKQSIQEQIEELTFIEEKSFAKKEKMLQVGTTVLFHGERKPAVEKKESKEDQEVLLDDDDSLLHQQQQQLQYPGLDGDEDAPFDSSDGIFPSYYPTNMEEEEFSDPQEYNAELDYTMHYSPSP